MENITKILLFNELKNRNISINSMYNEIEKIYEPGLDKYVWISRSTLERKANMPENFTIDEMETIIEAVRRIITEVEWIHIEAACRQKKNQKYYKNIDKSISEYPWGIKSNEKDFDIEKIKCFYNNAPGSIKRFWNKYLILYLKMPKFIKASISCSCYIGKNAEKNEIVNDNLINFMSKFPLMGNISDFRYFKNKDMIVLSRILKASSETYNPEYDIYRRIAYSKDNIKLSGLCDNNVLEDNEYAEIIKECVNLGKQYGLSEDDLIHMACLILFLDRTEWLLIYYGYVFSCINKSLDKKESYELFNRGCTTYKFTDNEMGYLCELMKVVGK